MSEEVIQETSAQEITQEAPQVSGGLLNGSLPPVPEAPVEQISAEDKSAQIAEFLKDLPEELRGKPSLQTFKSKEDLARSYIELQSKLGKRFEDLTVDEIKQLDKRLGVPEDPTKYNFNDLELPDEVQINMDELEEYREIFHSLGLPEEKARQLVQQYVAKDAEKQRVVFEQYNQRREQEVNSLKHEYGHAFDERIVMANDALRELGGEDVVKVLTDYGLDTNPALVKMFVRLNEFVAEDSLKGDGSRAVNGALTPDEARAEIQNKLQDPEFNRRYFKGTPEQRRQAGAELSELGRYISR